MPDCVRQRKAFLLTPFSQTRPHEMAVSMVPNIQESYRFHNTFNCRSYNQLLLPCFLTHSFELGVSL